MKYVSHIVRLRAELRNCLSGDRKEIVANLFICAERAQSLLKNSEFDFWIRQMRLIDPHDIPMTVYGLRLVEQYLKAKTERSANSRQTLVDEISSTCERLLTYMREGDDCPMQTEYHYYSHEAENVVFKESRLGSSSLPEEVRAARPEQIRIASVSELDVNPNELVS